MSDPDPGIEDAIDPDEERLVETGTLEPEGPVDDEERLVEVAPSGSETVPDEERLVAPTDADEPDGA